MLDRRRLPDRSTFRRIYLDVGGAISLRGHLCPDILQVLGFQNPWTRACQRPTRLKARFTPHDNVRNPLDCGEPMALTFSMASYPVVYSFLVLPISIGRWIGFVQETHGDRQSHVPAGATIAVQLIFCLSGISNVILFFSTRPNLLLFKKDEPEKAYGAPMAVPSDDADSIGGDE